MLADDEMFQCHRSIHDRRFLETTSIGLARKPLLHKRKTSVKRGKQEVRELKLVWSVDQTWPTLHHLKGDVQYFDLH
jgi:hypothetical protein